MSLLLLFGGSIAEVTGTVAETLADVTSAAAGGSGASATLAETFDDLTSAASGSSVTGTLAETLDAATIAASGAAGGASGTVTETLDDVTSSAAGTAGNDGTLAETLDAVTSAASGTHGVPGTVAVTLADVTSAAVGTQGLDGTLAVTLADVTSAAEAVTGYSTLAETLADITSTASGTHTELVTTDPSPVKCTLRRQKFSRKFRYHRHAERPAIEAWALDARNDLINFADASYTFTFRIGNPADSSYVEKTTNIVGAVGSGVMRNGTPNLTIKWEPGELDIDPGLYTCELIASSDSLDVVFHGHIQILDRILP